MHDKVDKDRVTISIRRSKGVTCSVEGSHPKMKEDTQRQKPTFIFPAAHILQDMHFDMNAASEHVAAPAQERPIKPRSIDL